MRLAVHFERVLEVSLRPVTKSSATAKVRVRSLMRLAVPFERVLEVRLKPVTKSSATTKVRAWSGNNSSCWSSDSKSLKKIGFV